MPSADRDVLPLLIPSSSSQAAGHQGGKARFSSNIYIIQFSIANPTVPYRTKLIRWFGGYIVAKHSGKRDLRHFRT
jgi:hypothetical protein